MPQTRQQRIVAELHHSLVQSAVTVQDVYALHDRLRASARDRITVFPVLGWQNPNGVPVKVAPFFEKRASNEGYVRVAVEWRWHRQDGGNGEILCQGEAHPSAFNAERAAARANPEFDPRDIVVRTVSEQLEKESS
jgi:hypothetical protein